MATKAERFRASMSLRNRPFLYPWWSTQAKPRSACDRTRQRRVSPGGVIMASIERTAYPRFKEKLSDSELEVLYQPNESELDFVRHHSRGDNQRLTLLALLKCHQHLGYLPSLKEIPKQVVVYLRNQLEVPQDTPIASEVERSRYRYIKQIRSFLQVKSYSHGGQEVAESVIKKSAYTMSDPADLINVAIEKLIEQRFELPAFSTLDRLVGHLRQEVHEILYLQITTMLTDEQRQCLDKMLIPQEGERITAFTRLTQVPGKPTLKHMRLCSLRSPTPGVPTPGPSQEGSCSLGLRKSR